VLALTFCPSPSQTLALLFSPPFQNQNHKRTRTRTRKRSRRRGGSRSSVPASIERDQVNFLWPASTASLAGGLCYEEGENKKKKNEIRRAREEKKK
jgi:hypothetical protein